VAKTTSEVQNRFAWLPDDTCERQGHQVPRLPEPKCEIVKGFPIITEEKGEEVTSRHFAVLVHQEIYGLFSP
jgi:hypothetical protein